MKTCAGSQVFLDATWRDFLLFAILLINNEITVNHISYCPETLKVVM